jgi:hypothetical protein
MRIPRYWAKATAPTQSAAAPIREVSVWRGSDESREEAQRQADEAARRLAERLSAGNPLPDVYGYGDRPLREELLKEINANDGQPLAIVTRNSYGAVVLNTASLMFIDVDVPDETPTGQLLRAVRGFFGHSPPTLESQTRDAIAEWIAAHPELSGRWYKTAAGYRLMITSRAFAPTSDESLRLLELAAADPLYIRLCKTQECFRARLTPKAWRCGMPQPPAVYPFDTPENESAYRRWEEEYSQSSASYATCRLLETFGNGDVLSEFLPLVELHDGLSKASEALPLA